MKKAKLGDNITTYILLCITNLFLPWQKYSRVSFFQDTKDKPYAVELQGLNTVTDVSFTTGILNSFIAADKIVFGMISGDFLFLLQMVCCMYSLESPR